MNKAASVTILPMPSARKLLSEAFGTFCLLFAGCGAMVVDEVTGGGIGHVGVALTWGMIVSVMICAIGGISGAHINPAVTLGFWLARVFPGKAVLPYVAAQTAGALAAAGVLRLMFPQSVALGATLPWQGDVALAFGLEVFLTLILMFVILCVAIGSKEKGLIPAIAIGATVGLEAMFAGPISGASMNPARSLAPALVSGQTASLWAYLLATTIGACLAVPLWRLLHRPGD